jgi:lia operon protein LiaG
MSRFTSICYMLLLAAPAVVRAQSESVTLTGARVAIYNLVGTLRVEPGTSPGGVIVDVKRAGADAGRLRLERGDIDGWSTLRVVYPADRVRTASGDGGTTTELRVRDDGTFGDENLDDAGRAGDGGRHRHRGGWGDGRKVTISDRGEGLDARADLLVRVPRGSRAALHLAVGNVTVANVDGKLSIAAQAAPVLASGTKGALWVDVGSGRVQVTQAEGVLEVETGSGEVAISRFQGSLLEASTGSGDVSGDALTADEVSVETGSGDIHLNGVSAPVVSLETGSGGVDADLLRDIVKLSAETGSGDIAIRAPASLGASLEIETASGDIETDFPLEVTRHGRDHVVGTIGDGKGTIAIETGSGGVRLLKRPS